MALVDQGAIDGYTDGTFEPYQPIERGQVAKILVDALNLDTPNNVEEAVSAYSDVNPSDSYANEIAAVTEAKVFEGNNGQFNPYDNIDRQQMAKVIVEAFGLNEYDDGEDVDVNFDAEQMGSTYQSYVQTLANLGITDSADEFEGLENLQRDQFAAFVVRTQNVVEENAPGVENIQTDVNDNNEFTISGKATGSADAVHLMVKNEDGEAVVNDENITLDSNNNFSFTIDEALDTGEYDYTIMGMENGNHGTEDAQYGSFTVEAPAIQDVSANTPSTVEVNFNQKIDSVDRDDVTVEDADSGKKQFVKSVDIADDGLSATVEFYDDLPAESTYNVGVNVDGDTLEGEVAIGDLEPATIEADAQQAINADAEANDQKVDFTVYDADGVDITENYKADDFNYTSKAIDDSGVVDLGADASTTTKVQFTNADGEVVAESNDIKLVANEAQIDEISNWTTGDADFDAEDYEQVTDAKQGDSLNIEVKDQFGNTLTENDDYTVEYESLDTSVAIVDKNTGELNAVNKTGTAPVKISVKQDNDVVLTKTVEVTAKEDSVLDSIALNNDSLDLSTADTDGVTVKADLQDQYGETFDEDSTKFNVSTDNNELNITDENGNSDNEKDQSVTVHRDNGQLEFKVAADDKKAKEGSYEVTITAGEGNDAVEKTLDVELAEPGELDHYDVRGLEDSLDLNDNNEDTTHVNNGAEDLSVIPVDANGYATSTALDDGNITTEIKDENGDPIEGFSSIDETGSYTIEVSNEDGVVKTHEFKVVDTSETADVRFTSADVDLAEGDGSSELITELEGITEIDGSKATDGNIKGVDFETNADSVVPSDLSSSNTVSEGKATIYIDTLDVDGEDIDIDNQPINVTVEASENN